MNGPPLGASFSVSDLSILSAAGLYLREAAKKNGGNGSIADKPGNSPFTMSKGPWLATNSKGMSGRRTRD